MSLLKQPALSSLSEWRPDRWASAAGAKDDGQVSVYQSEGWWTDVYGYNLTGWAAG